ncbi:exopolysaccharide biosynthesis polyprenyl glycosylphosphotransferase [Bellilinea caldifistulae]|uniref:sugar transferase n=1 Tax=Bellilinea caldifistulae TaxID=360411 RepID=UPI0007840B16|nr:sugar transferase [Bellilinea caldifistulae]GAP10751.1 exopolysaccharide biosynthesis polyprenyl glycosylphosphotransferase [Bellilinea caldifistulae]
MRSSYLTEKELTKDQIREKTLLSTTATKTRSRYWEWLLFSVILLISDGLNIGLGLRFAYLIRFELTLPIFDPRALTSVDYYEGLILLIIPTWLAVFLLRGLYKRENLLGGVREYHLLFEANTLAMIIVIAVGYFEPRIVFARGWILIAWLSAFFFTALGRFLLRRVAYFLRTYGYFLSRAVIVGYNQESAEMAQQLSDVRHSGLSLLGFVTNTDNPTGNDKGLRILGEIRQLGDLIERHRIDEVILTSSALSREELLDIFEKFGTSDKAKLRISSGLYEIITTGLSVREFAWVPLVEVNKVRLTGSEQVLKAALDYGVSIPLLILISPLLLLIAVAIKLDSPGPVIHRRRVLGVNGKEFDAFKFRTMVINGDDVLEQYPEKKEELVRYHKIKDDPRITRIGRILRKTSLDELPQLFNVLRNEMSLVGPRMITAPELEEYKKWGINLLTVKPGITGKWQVSGRSDVSYQERVRFDMYYIRNWNIWMDIQLIIQTIPAILSKRGAY